MIAKEGMRAEWCRLECRGYMGGFGLECLEGFGSFGYCYWLLLFLLLCGAGVGGSWAGGGLSCFVFFLCIIKP